MQTIARQRPLRGCDEILIPEPLKYFQIKGSEYIEIKEPDLSKYKLIGMNKDFQFFTI